MIHPTPMFCDMNPVIPAYKLFRLRKDFTLGSLFIDNKVKLPIGEWMKAKSVRTKGFAFRPGWHCCSTKSAPHLSKKKRVWALVWLQGVTLHRRPRSQGGLWYTAEWMYIDRLLPRRKA